MTGRAPLPGLRRCIAASVAVAIGTLAAAACAADVAPSGWSLLPMPALARPLGSGVVTIAGGATVAVRGDDSAALKAVVGNFAQRVASVRGLPLRTTASGDGTATITFEIKADASVVGDEGYAITIDKAGILVTARTVRGAFNGSATVWQLLTPPGWTRGAVAQVPYGSIEDHPRFAWRALLLDSSRHYQSADEIKKLIDWMSLDKLNVLVWHITDDQGWRLPVPKYPELATKGGCREAVGNDSEVSGGRDTPYCKVYTAAEIGDIVRYAAERNVEIVPEIDLPGHSQATIAAYPWLGVTGKRPPVWTDWGVSPWLLNPNAKTLQFVNDVMDEVMRLFPSRYVSIGGDEADKQQWNASPEVNAQMKALKLASMDELQGWFMRQVASYLVAHGRTPVGWDDEVDAGVALPREQVVMSWHGDHDERVALAALRQGHDVVMTPQESLYFDHLQSTHPGEWAGPPPVVSLRQAYDTQLIPPGTTPEEATHIIGVQAGLWAEQLLTFANHQHATFPRIAALAELGWSPAASHDWSGFLGRLPAELRRYRVLGIASADTAFAATFDVSPEASGGFRVTLANQAVGGDIRYTTDGTEPGVHSPLYTQPFTQPAGTTMRAAVYAADGTLLAAARSIRLDDTTRYSRESTALQTCSGEPASRLQGAKSAGGTRPVYSVEIGNACWLWPQANVEGATRVTVTAERLPWRYGDEARGAIVRDRHGRGDAIEIHVNGCDGPPLATAPLAATAPSGGQVRREAKLSTPIGADAKALCVFVTGDPREGQWALGTISFSK
ncbi:beta-N-acetylhexosaminidase [Luteibacter aegosomatissinici]|uniref:beta-N-acetylhexosaminidase n=1 Tax=Luteibacter aegosomatissinici TaxID=2911539 RepID=UPI001FF7192E|nr:family 20 glycosylhydrolase [Luteibacter aegosomatissinici]UPG95029.1 family 20 glycosylhydrolase [Luteibacter aegosomatissinici]